MLNGHARLSSMNERFVQPVTGEWAAVASLQICDEERAHVWMPSRCSSVRSGRSGCRIVLIALLIPF